MPSVNPIIEGTGGPAAAPPAAHESGGSVPPTTGSVNSRTGFGFPGLGEFTASENTSTHVAILVLISLGIIFGLWYGGFSFGVDAGVTK